MIMGFVKCKACHREVVTRDWRARKKFCTRCRHERCRAAAPHRKLTDDAVRTMRARYQEVRRVQPIAEAFGLSFVHAWRVIKGEAWAHVV